jgi:hypothetical protein
VPLFEGIQTDLHHSSSPTIWDPNFQTVASLLSSRSARTPIKQDPSTVHGKFSFVPFEGAAPLISLAPQPTLSPSRSMDSDRDIDTAFNDFDIKKDQSTPSSNAVQTLRECYCPFGKSTTWDQLYNFDGVVVPAKIFARFRSKSLDRTCANEPHHITYRRNYFANEMWFDLDPPTESADGRLYVNYEGTSYPVQSFGVQMRAVDTDEQGADVEISVFTPKRDRPIVPTPALEQKMQPNMPNHSHVYDESTRFGSNKLSLPTIHSCLHNQFRQATKNNGSRRKEQSYYRIVVELRVFIVGPSGNEVPVKIASTISGLLVVRGRCPGSFADDPNFQRSKPRRVSHRRREFKAARSTKKRGQSTSTSYKAPKKVGSRRTSVHTVNSAVPSSMASLTSDSRSWGSTNITSFSESPQMSPRAEIRKRLRLPTPNRCLFLPVFLESAGSSLAMGQQNGTFRDEVFTSQSRTPYPMANEIIDEHKNYFATQLDQYGFGFGQGGYPDLLQSPEPALQSFDVSSTTWENTNVHVGYAQ